MQKKTKILLASISFSAYEWLPYPVGCLISHCKKDAKINEMYEFMDPEYRSQSLDKDDFHENLKQADMLGLTNWVWNQNYNDRISKLYKEYRPDGLVIYGGTNVPEEKEASIVYAQERPYVDIFFTGPAEETFKNFLLDYPSKGLVDHTGTFTLNENHTVKDKYQYANIDIPSPYLDGTFDNIIKNSEHSLSALFETNRGCPYSCAFCDWGGLTRSKIIKTDPDTVKDTISYIMKHENIDRIEIGDANFGIFKEDLDYTNHLIEEKAKRKKEISLSMGGFAKNGGKYVEEIMHKMHEHFDSHHGRKYIKLSFQSHDKEVLDTIQRSNIDNTKLYPMMKNFQQQGIDVDAEMIIGMPGDTQDKWLETIQKNMDFNINHQKSFSLWIVPNTPMATKEYQEKYKIKTKKILVPYDLDQYKTIDYHLNNNIETNCKFDDPSEYQCLEFIYECFSFDSQELMKIYDVWFWFNTLYNTKIARKWMLESNDTAKQQYQKFLELLEDNKMPFFKQLRQNFQSAIWNTLAVPEDVTKLKTLSLVNFLTKFSIRGNEIVDIYTNKEKSLQELKLLYPNINFDHFKKIKVDKDLIKLYYVTAEVA